MKQSWTKGLADKQAKEIISDYKSSALLRERLTEMLRNKIKEKEKKGRSEDMYQSPNWSLTQADMNASVRTLEEVISLIE